MHRARDGHGVQPVVEPAPGRLLADLAEAISVLGHIWKFVLISIELEDGQRRAPLAGIAAHSRRPLHPRRWVELEFHEGRTRKLADVVRSGQGCAVVDVRVAVGGARDVRPGERAATGVGA